MGEKVQVETTGAQAECGSDCPFRLDGIEHQHTKDAAKGPRVLWMCDPGSTVPVFHGRIVVIDTKEDT